MERLLISLKHDQTSRPSSATTRRSSTKLSTLLLSQSSGSSDDHEDATQSSSASSTNIPDESSPGHLAILTSDDNIKSPWSNLSPASPYTKSPWTIHAPPTPGQFLGPSGAALIQSLVREQGHIYSLAAFNGLLYTGSESKNIRVWHRRQELCGFKSASGLVKAIIIVQYPAGSGSTTRIFTGHQDGKIRVWRVSTTSRADTPIHVKLGSLPRLWHMVRGSVMPSNYVATRRNRTALWMRHQDAVSCLCASADGELLYSGSWDRTLKVWRVEDSRCVESVAAHDDAINAVATAPLGFFDVGSPLVFSGSADGTVKAWRMVETHSVKGRLGSRPKHVLVQTLSMKDCAVTSLAVSPGNHAAGRGPGLYSGTSDGLVNFWLSMGYGKKDQQLLVHGGTLRGHKLAVLCMAATDGALVLSGSADGTICVWRRDSGSAHSHLSILSGHSGPVKCLAVEAEDNRDGRRWVVYSGSLDKSVKVWRLFGSDYDDAFPLHRLQQRNFPYGSLQR